MFYSEPDPICMLSFLSTRLQRAPSECYIHLQLHVLFVSFHSLVHAFVLLKKQLM